MPAQHPRIARWSSLGVFACVAGLALTLPAAADVLPSRQGANQVLVQKTTTEINGLLAEARKAAGKNAAQANAYVKQARNVLEDAVGLTDEQRSTLGALITRTQQQIQNGQRETDLKAREQADRDDLQRREQLRRDEEEAKKNAAIGKANDFIKTGKKAIDTAKDLKDKREKGIVAVGQDVLKTASGMTEERITAAFVAASDRRKPKLTEAEKHLIKMLNSTLSVDFNKQSLKDVLEFIHDKTGINIFPDEGALKEAMIEYDTPVSLKVKKATVRTILKKVLADVGLTFIVKDAAIHATTPERAREHVVVRAYPIGDLVGLVDPRWGPYANRMQTLRAAEQIMNLIVSTVEPQSWEINGTGRGRIRFDEITKSLIISNSAEFHYQMGGFLGR